MGSSRSFQRLRSGRVHPDVDAGGVSKASSGLSQRSFKRTASGRVGAAADVDRARGMSEEEHTAWILDKVAHDGRRSAALMLKFYLRMLGPVLAMTLFTFGTYSAISWSIPNLLCNTIAKENSGATFGLTECLYNNQAQSGGYTVKVGSKLVFLIFWTVENVWNVCFGGYITYCLFGPAYRKRERMLTFAIATLVACIIPVAGPRYGLSLNNMGIVLGVGIGSNLVMLATSNASARYTANPLMRLRWINMLLLSAFVSNVYFFLLPMALTARAADAMGGLALSFLRVVIHPAMWGVLLIAFRFFLRNCGYLPDLRAGILLCWPMLYSSLYGRFLLLQMDSVGSVVIVNLLFAFVDLAGRLRDRDTDGVALKLMYGERVRDTVTATRDTDEKRMADVFMGLMMELMSIFCASAILSFGGVATSPGVPPAHFAIWVNAGLQAATTLGTEFVGLVMEGKFHDFDWRRSYTTCPVRLTLLIGIMEFIGGSRLCVELIGIFCPQWYPERGIILLEQCDKPSLFQAITFSSAYRFRMVGSYFNLTGGVFNMTGGPAVNSV